MEATPETTTRASDLSRQVRNALLLSPIHSLEHEKKRLAPNHPDLFEGIDTLYLSFSLFDFISEHMVFGPGATSEEILQHLGQEVIFIKPSLTSDEIQVVAKIILDRLSNSRERHQAFSFPLFDARDQEIKLRHFRLLAYHPADEGAGHYVLTQEGFAVYLSMLELDPEVAQQINEIMIQQLIKRGRFRDARELASRNQMQTKQYLNQLLELLRKIQRNIRTTDWQVGVKPRLDQARYHFEDRIREEGSILMSVPGYLEQAADDQIPFLLDLQDMVQDCQKWHGQLHRMVMDFYEEFQRLQAFVFRSAGMGPVADLEQDVLAPLSMAPVEKLAPHAREITVLLNPGKPVKLFDPFLLVHLIEQQSEVEETPLEESSEAMLEEIPAPAMRFSKELIHKMTQYLEDHLPENESVQLDALLQHALEDQLDKDELLCLTYLILGKYGSDERVTGLKFEKLEPFQLSAEVGVSGDNLRITKEGS